MSLAQNFYSRAEKTTKSTKKKKKKKKWSPGLNLKPDLPTKKNKNAIHTSSPPPHSNVTVNVRCLMAFEPYASASTGRSQKLQQRGPTANRYATSKAHTLRMQDCFVRSYRPRKTRELHFHYNSKRNSGSENKWCI